MINKTQLSSLDFKINRRFEKNTFTDDDINLLIKNLNVDKEHLWDNISIRRKIHCTSIKIDFPVFSNDGFSRWLEKKVMLSHVIKSLTKNYRPISFLPIFSEVFERLTCNSLYSYFVQNWLSVWFYTRGFMCLTVYINYWQYLQVSITIHRLIQGTVHMEAS